MKKSLSFPLKGIKKKEPTKLVRITKEEEEKDNIPSALKEYERLQKENKQLKEENEILKSKDENEILKLSEDIWDKYDEVKIRYIIRDDDGQINSEREKILQKEDNLTDFFNNLKTIPNEEELEKNGFEKKLTIHPIKRTLFSNNIKSLTIEKDELIEKEKEIIQNKKTLKNKLNQIVNGQELKNSKLLFGDEIFVDSILEFGEEKELDKVLNKMGANNIPIDEIANQKNRENQLNMSKKDIGGKFIFDILSDRKIFMKRQLLRKAIYKMLEKKPPINRFEVLRSLISDFKSADFYIQDAIIHYYKRIFFDILNENKEE